MRLADVAHVLTLLSLGLLGAGVVWTARTVRFQVLCAGYMSNLTISADFDASLHPWLIDGGRFYVNEAVEKDDPCHAIVKDYFVRRGLTVQRHAAANEGRRLQSWVGSGQ
jgi:hypothetical protein